MRTVARIVLAFMVLVAADGRIPASAVVISSCGGELQGGGRWNQCTFFLAGSYLYLEGETSGSEIDVSIKDPGDNFHLVNCYETGARARCSAWSHDPLTGAIIGSIVHLPVGARLICRARNSGLSGTYRCLSAGF